MNKTLLYWWFKPFPSLRHKNYNIIGWIDLEFLVSEFAKKTGDFQSLSIVDLKVLALTYQLHKEKCGKEGLREEPTKQVYTGNMLHWRENLKIISFPFIQHCVKFWEKKSKSFC